MDILQSHITHIEEGAAARPDIELRTLPAQQIRCTMLEHDRTMRKSSEFFRRAYAEILHCGNPGCPLGMAYDDFLALLAHPNQPSQLVSYDPQGPDLRPEGQYLVGTVNCFYNENHGLVQRMSRYAERNNLVFLGPVYSVYLHDAASVTEPEQFLLQIAVGIRRKDDTD